MYRGTYVEVNLKNIKENVEKIVNKYDQYSEFFGVVKADSYGHQGIESVKAIIEGGATYLATATLAEALEIRKEIKYIPILCLGIIPKEDLEICEKENITITISSIEYFNQIKELGLRLKVHLKINTGMNRLGISKESDLTTIYNEIIDTRFNLEGIYSHIYQTSNREIYISQLERFEEITTNIDIYTIPIRHIAASSTIVKYEKPVYINSCRLGILMYGFEDKNNELNLKSTFSLFSKIIEIQEVNENETVGYEGVFRASKKTRIGIIPIGYADGIIRANKDRFVYINSKQYRIVGNVCMDMLFVEIDENVNVDDKVEVIRDKNHINEIAEHLNTIPYEVLCMIGKRVPRIYV